MMDDYEKYHRLAYKIAMPFLRGFPRLYDDIEGAALLGLCEGLNKAKKRNHPNPGALVILYVKFEIVKCLQYNFCIIRLPRSLVRKERLRAYLCKEEFSLSKLYPQIFSLSEQSINQDVFYNDVKWQELKQQISEISLTELEEKVLIYRLSDYTYQEIADNLTSNNYAGKQNYSDAGVIRIMERVKKKWSKKIS